MSIPPTTYLIQTVVNPDDTYSVSVHIASGQVITGTIHCDATLTSHEQACSWAKSTIQHHRSRP